MVLAIISNLRSQLLKRRLWFRTAVFASLMISSIMGGIKEDAENMIISEFGNESTLSFTKYILTSTIKSPIERKVKQHFNLPFVYIWVVSQNDTVSGFAILDNVKGKSMPITFIGMYNNKGAIIKTAVVKYREAIGGEVGQPSWQKQFIGKSKSSAFTDVDAISGATISVHAVTKGIHKLTILLDIIKSDLTTNE